ncbi:hypothetical protein A5636_18200 [Mycobacterium asiaticum]|uniref:PknH-like extracellular domain-containing protein n=1 Tax=Mycobacterium asiaticum TaxID=1790 RepID=A0A1A3NCN4_MYCAS|nr:hypothetical protein A5636_18200 [Mycobacterium asiaticum]
MGCCLVLAACDTVVDGTPRAAPRGAAPTGPIFPSQLEDLLTASGSFAVVANSPLTETDMQSAMFIGADPDKCHGAVAFGRFPLFPKNYTGREARTQQDHQVEQHQLLEVSATYPSDFSAAEFLESVRKTVSECQGPVTAWGDDGRRATVNATPLVSGPAEFAQWATNLAGQKWVCEFAVIAKANVVSEIVTCSPDRSIDIATLVTKRLKKIDELLKSRS